MGISFPENFTFFHFLQVQLEVEWKYYEKSHYNLALKSLLLKWGRSLDETKHCHVKHEGRPKQNGERR